jgi:hypothetical protein
MRDTLGGELHVLGHRSNLRSDRAVSFTQPRSMTHLGYIAGALPVLHSLWRNSIRIYALPWQLLWRSSISLGLLRRPLAVARLLLLLSRQTDRSEVIAAIAGGYRAGIILQVLRDGLQARAEEPPAPAEFECVSRGPSCQVRGNHQDDEVTREAQRPGTISNVDMIRTIDGPRCPANRGLNT